MIIILLAGSWLVFSGRLPVLLGLVTPTPTALTDESSALSRLLNLLPENAQPSLMNPPKTTVDLRHGPGPAERPGSAKEAATLFGSAGLWTSGPTICRHGKWSAQPRHIPFLCRTAWLLVMLITRHFK
ncbi:MAG: hypothetical protein U0V02_17185 [Anaerolineales bacterium]